MFYRSSVSTKQRDQDAKDSHYYAAVTKPDTNLSTPTSKKIHYPTSPSWNEFQYKKEDDRKMITHNPIMNDRDSDDKSTEMIVINISPPSSPTTDASSHGQSSPMLMEYNSSRFNICWRCMKRRPRTCGALIVFAVCVLPLMITTGLLAAMVDWKWTGMRGSSINGNPVWQDFVVHSDTAAVATDDARCSFIGKDMLAQGGSAIDAAIAATMCLGVVSPGSSGIGGGCFILTHNGTTRINEFIDSREVAPAAATSDMFVKSPIKAQDGGLAIAVFSELKGLHLAWTKHGKLPWSVLVQPASDLAKRWVVSKETASLLQQVQVQLHSGLYPGTNSTA